MMSEMVDDDDDDDDDDVDDDEIRANNLIETLTFLFFLLHFLFLFSQKLSHF